MDALGIDKLQNTDRKGGSLASSRLSLGDRVGALDDGENSSLLDDAWLLKAVAIDAS